MRATILKCFRKDFKKVHRASAFPYKEFARFEPNLSVKMPTRSELTPSWHKREL